MQSKSWSSERKVIKKKTFKEYVEVIQQYYPEIAEAIEITQVTFKMMGKDNLNYDRIYNHYPHVYLTHYTNSDELEIMVDFSISLSFFVKKRNNRIKMTFFGDYPEDFHCPKDINLNNIKELMYKIVYQNYLHETKRQNELFTR